MLNTIGNENDCMTAYLDDNRPKMKEILLYKRNSTFKNTLNEE